VVVKLVDRESEYEIIVVDCNLRYKASETSVLLVLSKEGRHFTSQHIIELYGCIVLV